MAIDTGSKKGDLSAGHTASVLSCDIRMQPKPQMLILGGEDKEIQVFKGVAFKIEKSI